MYYLVTSNVFIRSSGLTQAVFKRAERQGKKDQWYKLMFGHLSAASWEWVECVAPTPLPNGTYFTRFDELIADTRLDQGLRKQLLLLEI